jgi:hypothetical protein
MSASAPRSWTVDERIDDKERRGIIATPFTQEERELARHIAAAWHFVWYQQELPGRCLEASDDGMTPDMGSLEWGIFRVQVIRGDVPELTSHHTTA